MSTYRRLPDYLWGIETHKIFGFAIDGNSCFQTTYEELKHGFFCLGMFHVNSFQTTYEELKHLFSFSFIFDLPASRLPMRNWNPPIWSQTIKTTLCFQTTYEELKHEFPSLMASIIATSRLPMRNWNLFSFFVISVGCPCFQTTYEELKLSSKPTSWSFFNCASRLPMRNWNPLAAGNQVYPWYTASRLPMRNWNQPMKL